MLHQKKSLQKTAKSKTVLKKQIKPQIVTRLKVYYLGFFCISEKLLTKYKIFLKFSNISPIIITDISKKGICIMNIWSKRPDDMYKLNDVIQQDIDHAEKLFNVKFPEKYVDIIKEQNGGEIIYNAYPTSKPTAWNDSSGYIDHIMGIGKEPGLLDTPYYLSEWEMPSDIILISGDGHEWVAFDYRKTKENPPIIYINNDNNEIITVANTFDEFLSILYVEKNNDNMQSEEYEVFQVSQEEFETLIIKNKIDDIVVTIDRITQDFDEMDKQTQDWFTNKLKELSTHKNSYVRRTVIEAIGQLVYSVDKDVINKFLKVFEKDSNSDVLYILKLVKENIYSER